MTASRAASSPRCRLAAAAESAMARLTSRCAAPIFTRPCARPSTGQSAPSLEDRLRSCRDRRAAGDGVVARGGDGSEAKGACLIGADGIVVGVARRISPGGELAFRRRHGLARATAARRDRVSRSLRRARGRALARAARASRSLSGRRRRRSQHRRRTVGGAPRASRPSKDGASRATPADACSQASRAWTKDAKSLLEQCGSLARLVALSPHRPCNAGRRAASRCSAMPPIPCCPISRKAPLSPSRMPARSAACLAAAPSDPASAFRRYEQLRRPRAARVQRAARRFGLLYHLGAPLALARNFMLARRSEETALRRFDWLYRQGDENQ